MLSKTDERLALLCIDKLEKLIVKYEKEGYPESIGMKGLFELNTKDMIQYKIKNIKKLIVQKEKASIEDVQYFCNSDFDLIFHELQKQEQERKKQKFLNKLHTLYKYKY
jgi:hypothetical protein